MDEDYIAKVVKFGVFRGWLRTFSDIATGGTDSEAHPVKYRYGNTDDPNDDASYVELAGGLAESDSFQQIAHMLKWGVDDVLDDRIFELKVEPQNGASTAIQSGPMEFLINMPVNVGCFQVMDGASLTPAAEPDLGNDVYPTKCLAKCLGDSNFLNRYPPLMMLYMF